MSMMNCFNEIQAEVFLFPEIIHLAEKQMIVVNSRVCNKEEIHENVFSWLNVDVAKKAKQHS